MLLCSYKPVWSGFDVQYMCFILYIYYFFYNVICKRMDSYNVHTWNIKKKISMLETLAVVYII